MQEVNSIEECQSAIVKQDGSHWVPAELRRALGPHYRAQNGNNGYSLNCFENNKHSQSYVSWEVDEAGYAAFRYKCLQCARDYGISDTEQFSIFKSWLQRHELLEGRWLRHMNPFDHESDPIELGYVEDTEGQALFYRGGIHFVYGKPGTYKSWLALSTLARADVRIWDFENGIAGTLSRLKALGIQREQADGYTVPESPEEVLNRVREYVVKKPEILCIDGFSGFADVMGINPESNADVMRAFTEVFNPLKRAGITVIVLDHLPKDSSTYDYPIGAQAKKSQADAAYLFKHDGCDNEVGIFISKDRHGDLFERCESGALTRRYGSLKLMSDDSRISVVISPAYEASIDGLNISTADASLMQAIYKFVQENPESTKSDIERNVIGKTERKRKALQALRAGGYLAVRELGTSHLHSISKEFNPGWVPLGN